MALLIAHRGRSAVAPENTMAAFEAAVAAGFPWVETDVDLLADGTPVLLHDATLDRTTDGTGPVHELRAPDLARHDAGSHFSPTYADQRIPRLSELVDLANRTGLCLNLELKLSEATPARQAEYVDAVMHQVHRLRTDLILSSFDHELLALFHRTDPRIATAPLFHMGRARVWREIARQTGARFLHPHHAEITRGFVAEIREAGLRVNTWTVNSPGRARKLAEYGVHGICTDGAPELTPRTFRAHRGALQPA